MINHSNRIPKAGVETIRNSIREIIARVVGKIGGGQAAEELIYRTGLVETGYRTREQDGGGPALGFFQMEPSTHDDIWNNFLKYRPELAEKVRSFADDNECTAKTLRENDAYAAAMCRVQYLRDKAPLPAVGDVKAQADYWKRIYNTRQGAGTVAHFVAEVKVEMGGMRPHTPL